MTIEEIRANAPSGATHYDHDVKKYFRLSGSDLFAWLVAIESWNPIPIIFLDVERCTILKPL